MVLGPVLVTAAPPRTPKLSAVPKMDCASALTARSDHSKTERVTTASANGLPRSGTPRFLSHGTSFGRPQRLRVVHIVRRIVSPTPCAESHTHEGEPKRPEGLLV